MLGISTSVGYVGLGLLVGAESAGALVPGETALIVSGVLAHKGEMDIRIVIAVAAVAAIIGDNIGFLLGRHGVRRLAVRDGWGAEHRRAALRHGERFFAQHGGKAVFLARFVIGLRVVGAWVAGASNMHWRTFLLWNALGGIAWAAAIGTLAYVFGRVAEEIIRTAGIVGVALIVVVVAVALAVGYRHRRAVQRRWADEPSGGE